MPTSLVPWNYLAAASGSHRGRGWAGTGSRGYEPWQALYTVAAEQGQVSRTDLSRTRQRGVEVWALDDR